MSDNDFKRIKPNSAQGNQPKADALRHLADARKKHKNKAKNNKNKLHNKKHPKKPNKNNMVRPHMGQNGGLNPISPDLAKYKPKSDAMGPRIKPNSGNNGYYGGSGNNDFNSDNGQNGENNNRDDDNQNNQNNNDDLDNNSNDSNGQNDDDNQDSHDNDENDNDKDNDNNKDNDDSDKDSDSDNGNKDDSDNGDKDDEDSNSLDNHSDSNKDKDSDKDDDSDNPDDDKDDNDKDDSDDDSGNDDKDKDSDKSDDESSKDSSKDKDDKSDGKGGKSPISVIKRKMGLKKPKKFKDFLKKAKKNNRNKDNQDLRQIPSKIARAIMRFFQLLRLWSQALRMYALVKFIEGVQAAISWITTLVVTIGSFIASIGSAIASFFATLGSALWAVISGMVLIALFGVFLLVGAITSDQQQRQNQEMMNMYEELCVGGSKSKQSSSSSSDDSDSGGGGSTGKYKHIPLIHFKHYKNRRKNAISIAKAVAKRVHIPTSWAFAQIYAEESTYITGGALQPVVTEDHNLTGMGPVAGLSSVGSGHGEGDGSYGHYKDFEHFATAWAETLIKDVPHPKSIHSAHEFVEKLHEGGYMTASVDSYWTNFSQGLANYKHGNAGGAAATTGTDDGGSSAKSVVDKLRDDLCGTIKKAADDDSTGSIVREAKHFLHWFSYSQKNRSADAHWKHPSRSDMTDCSGFVWLVLKRVGCHVSSYPWATPVMESDAKGAHHWLRRIPASETKPGDILVVNEGGGSGDLGHTCILLQHYHGRSTKIIEEGGEPCAESQDHVNIHTIGYAFGSLFTNGRVTFCRALGGHHTLGGSGKKSKGDHVHGKEAKARAEIVKAESGGRWNAKNGKYYGRYQLDKAYLHHNYSHANQTRVANAYVKSRYGSWVKALHFRKHHGWY